MYIRGGRNGIFLTMPKRTNLAIDSRLYERLSEAAKREGRTIFSLSNYIFTIFLNALERGVRLDEIRAQCELRSLSKDLDLIVLPRNLVVYLIKRGQFGKGGEIEELFFSLGKEIGNHLRVEGETFEDILLKARLVYMSLGLKDLRVKVLNPREFLIFISSDMNDEVLIGLGCEFVKGFISSFGYNVVKTEIAKNVVSLRVAPTSHGQWFR